MTGKTKRDLVLKWHGRGYDTGYIAKTLGLPVAEVLAIITPPKPSTPPSRRHGPEFIQPPAFD